MNPALPALGVAIWLLWPGRAIAPTLDVRIEPWEDEPSSSGINPYISQDQKLANLSAFLAVIRAGESGGDYRALVGGGQFSDYSHHPGWTDASMTRKSAWAGRWNSHSAGAYQFQPGTFKEVSDALGLGGAFDPVSQDSAAVYNLKRKGAFDLVVAGDIYGAFQRLTREWIALPDRGIEWVISTYEANGGELA